MAIETPRAPNTKRGSDQRYTGRRPSNDITWLQHHLSSFVNMSLQWAEYVAAINPPTAKANAVILGAKLTRTRLGLGAAYKVGMKRQLTSRWLPRY